MSRDWTPFEHYLVEQKQIKQGYGDLFDFMANLKTVLADGTEVITNPPEEMAIRKEFPYLGKYLMDEFMDLHKLMSEFDGGLAFLHQKDAALGSHISSLSYPHINDRIVDEAEHSSDYLLKWFHGKLDEHFYYGTRNHALFVDSVLKEAIQLGLSSWIVTDPDCAQVRRQVGFEGRGIFELMQVDSLPDGTYTLSVGEIDFDDYSSAEINSALNGYGYDSIKTLIKATVSEREAYGQLAEMLFELSPDFGVLRFDNFNDAVAEVERRAGKNLEAFKEADSNHKKKPLDSRIEEASAKVVSADASQGFHRQREEK